jgi:type II secretory pathway pseudopilin PulG
MEAGSIESRAFPLTEILAVWMIVLVLLAFSAQGFYQSEYRARIARTLSELRNLALQIDEAYSEEGIYPPGEPFTGDVSDLSFVPMGTHSFEITELDFPRLNLLDRTLKVARTILWIVALALSFLLLYAIYRIGNRKFLFLLPLPFLGLWFSYIDNFLTLFGVAFLWWPLLLPAIYCLLWIGKNRFLNTRILRKEYFTALFPALYLLLMELSFLFVLAISGIYVGWKADRIPKSFYRYTTDGKSAWVLQSYGPDGEYALALESLWVKSSTDEALSLPMDLDERLNPYTYDPTNGTVSSGDIFRSGLRE